MFANIPGSLTQSAAGLDSLPRTRNVRAVQDKGDSFSPRTPGGNRGESSPQEAERRKGLRRKNATFQMVGSTGPTPDPALNHRREKTAR